MATLEAVCRRRSNRKCRTEYRHVRRKERQKRDADWSMRMIRRQRIVIDEIRLIHLDHRYWLARRCGWDALSPEYSRDVAGRPCYELESAMWSWWKTLHGKCRVKLARMLSVRLKSA